MKIQIAASAALVCCSILPACAKAPTKPAAKPAAKKPMTKAQQAKARQTKAQANARAQQAKRAKEKALLTSLEAEVAGAQAESNKAKADLAKSVAAANKPKEVAKVLNFSMKSLDGRTVKLDEFAGKTILIVNTASKCGFTRQYEGLQKLYEKHKGEGLVILGFPSGDFGGQELAEDEEIALFCKANYGVSFPMFSKVSVKGDSKVPLFKYLTDATTNPESPGEIGWNFEKFLIDPSGKIAARFKSGVTPESPELAAAIEKAMAA